MSDERFSYSSPKAGGEGYGESGDLFLKAQISEDRHFTVVGHDLYTVIAVSPWEAALGAKIQVKTVEGTVNPKIPARSQTGQKISFEREKYSEKKR